MRPGAHAAGTVHALRQDNLAAARLEQIVLDGVDNGLRLEHKRFEARLLDQIGDEGRPNPERMYDAASHQVNIRKLSQAGQTGMGQEGLERGHSRRAHLGRVVPALQLAGESLVECERAGLCARVVDVLRNDSEAGHARDRDDVSVVRTRHGR